MTSLTGSGAHAGSLRWRSGWSLLGEVLLFFGAVASLAVAALFAVFGSMGCGLGSADESCYSSVSSTAVLFVALAIALAVGGALVLRKRHKAGARARDSWLAVLAGLVAARLAPVLVPGAAWWLHTLLSLAAGIAAGALLLRARRRRPLPVDEIEKVQA